MVGGLEGRDCYVEVDEKMKRRADGHEPDHSAVGALHLWDTSFLASGARREGGPGDVRTVGVSTYLPQANT